MMTYDPYQTYPALGPYSGLAAQIGSPYAALQTSGLNPMALMNPLAAALGGPSIPVSSGIPQTGGQTSGFNAQGGINPQQLQLASVLASQAGIPQWLGVSPWATGLTNPLLAAALQNHNPLVAALLQNPQLNPILAATGHSIGSQLGYQPYPMYGQAGSPFGQQTGSPYWQQGSPFGQQTGSPYGQQGSPFGQQTGSPYGQQGSPFGQQFGSPYGQQGSPFGQQTGSPYGQLGSPFGQPFGSPFGQGGGSPYGQTGSPFGQQGGSPYGGQIGSQLAPQSWIGQGGPFGGQQFGQGNPLQSQFGTRPFQTSGISSWGY